MKVRDVLEGLDQIAPFSKAAEGDPVGLQIGDPERSIQRVAVCHEVTDSVVGQVVADPVDLLVSYHPLLYRPVQSLRDGPGPEGRALWLARSDTALIVAHTNFDVAPGGAADALAERLGLEGVRGFAPLPCPPGYKLTTFVPPAQAGPMLDALAGAGAGKIGPYTHCSFRTEGMGTFFAPKSGDPFTGEPGEFNQEPETRLEVAVPAERRDEVLTALRATHPYEEPAYDLVERRPEAGLLGRVGALDEEMDLAGMAERVTHALDAPAVRAAGTISSPVGKIAVVPGSGREYVSVAAAAGADALVTGDLTHHAAREALDLGLCLVDPGHAPTERPGVERLFAAVAALGAETANLLHLDPDPWRSVS